MVVLRYLVPQMLNNMQCANSQKGVGLGWPPMRPQAKMFLSWYATRQDKRNEQIHADTADWVMQTNQKDRIFFGKCVYLPRVNARTYSRQKKIQLIFPCEHFFSDGQCKTRNFLQLTLFQLGGCRGIAACYGSWHLMRAIQTQIKQKYLPKKNCHELSFITQKTGWFPERCCTHFGLGMLWVLPPTVCKCVVFHLPSEVAMLWKGSFAIKHCIFCKWLKRLHGWDGKAHWEKRLSNWEDWNVFWRFTFWNFVLAKTIQHTGWHVISSKICRITPFKSPGSKWFMFTISLA